MTYFRRYRMEFDLAQTPLPPARLPPGYRWERWQPMLLERHARVKYGSFQGEVDAQVFQCLGNLNGCRHLMHEIITQRNFVPAATWLITCPDPSRANLTDIPASTFTDATDGAVGLAAPPRPKTALSVDCGTIQGMMQTRVLGAVQNVGILPEHRGLGLGRALVAKALHGFKREGVRRVYLEVTADNAPAVGLYRAVGFRLVRTMYKAVEE
ncbi:MAG: GNAT family N-acetyltransferase [Planctomycetaceae bacterium]